MLTVFLQLYKKRVTVIVRGCLLLILMGYLEHGGLVLAPNDPWESLGIEEPEEVVFAEAADSSRNEAPEVNVKEVVEEPPIIEEHDPVLLFEQEGQAEPLVAESPLVEQESFVTPVEPVPEAAIIEEHPTPAPPTQATQPLQKAIVLRGMPISYENVGSVSGQAFIDTHRHMVATYFGNSHYRATNHTSTHFVGHIESRFGVLLSMTIGERFEIYDDLGQKATYTITDRRVVPIVSQMDYETYEYLDRIGDKKRVVLQTCTDHTARNALLTEGISTH